MKGVKNITYQLQDKGREKTPKALPRSLEQQLEDLPTAVSVVLGLIAFGGFLTMAALAPNAVQIFGKFLNKKHGRQYKQKEIEQKIVQTVYYLKKTGKITLKQENESIWIKLGRLTKKDKTILDINTLKISKPLAWDKTYWLVAADIPTKTHRPAADAFRRKLINLGFYPLQRSMWLLPYNPKKELQTIINYFEISNFVTLLHVQALDTEDHNSAVRYWKKHGVF